MTKRALKPSPATGVPILAYHDVAPLHDQKFRNITVRPQQFKWQMEYLAERGYTPLTASGYARCLAGETAFPHNPILITFDDGYANLIENAFPVLRRHGFPATVFVVTGKMGHVMPWDSRRTMTEKEIQDSARQGIEYGGHTRTHPDLRELPLEGIVDEIRGCSDDLERILGERPTAFSYPFGALNEAAIECARQEFKLAFSLEEGLNEVDTTDPAVLRRVEVLPDEGRIAFGWRLRYGFHPLRRLRMRIGLGTRLRKLIRAVKEPGGGTMPSVT